MNLGKTIRWPLPRRTLAQANAKVTRQSVRASVGTFSGGVRIRTRAEFYDVLILKAVDLLGSTRAAPGKLCVGKSTQLFLLYFRKSYGRSTDARA